MSGHFTATDSGGLVGRPRVVSCLPRRPYGTRVVQRALNDLSQGGPQQVVVLGSGVGGRWNTAAQRFLRDLLRVRAQRSSSALRVVARAGWTRRWSIATLAQSSRQAQTLRFSWAPLRSLVVPRFRPLSSPLAAIAPRKCPVLPRAECIQTPLGRDSSAPLLALCVSATCLGIVWRAEHPLAAPAARTHRLPPGRPRG